MIDGLKNFKNSHRSLISFEKLQLNLDNEFRNVNGLSLSFQTMCSNFISSFPTTIRNLRSKSLLLKLFHLYRYVSFFVFCIFNL